MDLMCRAMTLGVKASRGWPSSAAIKRLVAQVCGQALGAVFGAEPRVVAPAEGRGMVGREEADANASWVHALGRSLRGVDVGAKDEAAQTKIGVARQRNAFIDPALAKDRNHRPEDLFTGNAHPGQYLRKHGGGR
jgi:hypothetical protein